MASKGSENKYAGIKRLNPEVDTGLTDEQVRQRLEAGVDNKRQEGLSISVPKIFLKNFVSLFNIIYLLLGTVTLIVGHEIESLFFFGAALFNSAISIFLELRAKKVIDKLAAVSYSQVTVVRGGRQQIIEQDKIVIDDVVMFFAGNHICADGIVIESDGLEVEDALLTGKNRKTQKKVNDTVLAGSIVTGGQGYIRITGVGEENFINGLMEETLKQKKKSPVLYGALNRLIRILAVVMLPLGLLMYYSLYSSGGNEALFNSAIITSGIIPGGLVIFTTIAMAIGAFKIARKKASVQSAASVETMAQTDILCLDKTGTITDGTFEFERMELIGEEITENEASKIIAEIIGALREADFTGGAIRNAFGETNNWEVLSTSSFGAGHRWSGVSFQDKGSYILGAPEVLFKEEDFSEKTDSYINVVCLAYSPSEIEDNELPSSLECLALLLLSDNIRKNTAEAISFFAEENINICVISGDDPETAKAIALKAGIPGSDRVVDMNRLDNTMTLDKITEDYVVFGNTSPQQKKELIKAMRSKGHSVCMVGDGINDLPAMREADCSVAMGTGSSEARSICDFVLTDNDFGAMVDILKEGRKATNNVEKIASLHLLKTIYFILLSLIYPFIAYPYPFTPIQLVPVTVLAIGIPTVFIIMRQSYKKPGLQLIPNIIEHAVPAAVTIVVNTLYLQLVSHFFDMPFEESSTMIVFLIGIVAFYQFIRMSKPYTKNAKIIIISLISAFVILFIFLGNSFGLSNIFTRNIFFYLPLIYFSYQIHEFLAKICRDLLEDYNILKTHKSKKE